MVAKLAACQAALKGGTRNVAIVDGRTPGRLVKALAGQKTSATTVVKTFKICAKGSATC